MTPVTPKVITKTNNRTRVVIRTNSAVTKTPDSGSKTSITKVKSPIRKSSMPV